MVTSVTTKELASEFKSEYGWTISLPPGWEKLEDIGSVSLSGCCKPVVFSSPVDWSVAITWMRSPRPWPRDVVAQFDKLMATDGSVPVYEADTFLKTVFGTAGAVTEARTTLLRSGERALEVIEFIAGGPRPRCGYQLLMCVPAQSTPAKSPLAATDGGYFDRLVFYADASTFGQMLGSVRETCRKFERTSTGILRFDK